MNICLPLTVCLAPAAVCTYFLWGEGSRPPPHPQVLQGLRPSNSPSGSLQPLKAHSHTFEIKSNLISISNPIRAYAYPKCKKATEKIIKRKLTASQGRGPGRPGPGPGSQAQTGGAVGLRFIVFSMGFLHLGYAYALIGFEINIRLDLFSNVCIIIPAIVTLKPNDYSTCHNKFRGVESRISHRGVD